ncbi:hypothetical protein B0J12DRAFT_746459 [Macrophomina phaseolina]|uniref:Chromo domain-containing protein n=1 Tax=Macrophomina phaseolina TaxID=35725 RepID=A0ABQ8FSE6_9PEZI|nr:hypothetical protein B0J12DRAFT_746459 [Macrophomina phaseolina]
MPSIVILSQHCDVLNQRQLTYSLINVNQRQLLLGYGLATQRQRGPSLIDVALFPTLRQRRGRGKYLEYHVRFKGYDDEPGEWVREDMITQEAKDEYDAKHPRPSLPKDAPKETLAAPIPEQPAKRKRGRPRKNPLPSQA